MQFQNFTPTPSSLTLLFFPLRRFMMEENSTALSSPCLRHKPKVLSVFNFSAGKTQDVASKQLNPTGLEQNVVELRSSILNWL